MFDNVVDMLNRLDRDINMDLRPPRVLLDSTKSRDGRDVLATVGVNPQHPTRRLDHLHVPRNNSQFNTLGVRLGDHVRIFISDPMLEAKINVLQSPRVRQLLQQGGEIDAELIQSWIEMEVQNLGVTKSNFIELTVQSSISESALQLMGSLPEPITTPERIEIWRYADDRIREISQSLRRYERRARIGWEPSPDRLVLERVVERLNQWMRRRRPTAGWQPDPVLETIPVELRKDVTDESLGATTFKSYDGRLLQEAVWLRDISNWARGDSLDAVDQATHLFDWTVRNIQLEARQSPKGLHRRPWQTLIYGQGSTEERAWVFSWLCRQQGLDVVMLARTDPQDSDEWQDWLPALWSEEQLFLYDPWLGLPIPGPGDRAVATLSEVVADDGLLRQLDLDEEHPYPVSSADLDRVMAQIVATPVCLSQRMSLLEAKLAGDERFVVTAHATELTEILKTSADIESVRLWEYPFLTRNRQQKRNQQARQEARQAFEIFAWQPEFWTARVLHFQGEFEGDPSAKLYYLRARPSNAQIELIKKRAPQMADIAKRGKMAASYWFGLLTYDSRELDIALDYLKTRTLEADPSGPWTDGARYNLARTYEATGMTAQARQLYLADQSPQRHGNLLRARWLGRGDGETGRRRD